ncbi:hypothetical protein O6H91_14G073900 [Diphasiastrum complanatum]|uniref:Uncharacterized protein n=1 Tax=Diphasiastrum complanatum TaxID=34168 RepID=A0ACC2BQY8_DIPCM|nr:hypothetical protein O6H91_14G073900 [Diphasiastrum complanatum]
MSVFTSGEMAEAAAAAVMIPSPAALELAHMSPEEACKKIRKPYTITKSRESWTEQEHERFLEALQLFDRDWKRIEAFISSKTVIQIRSHAQKYFLKVQKNGTGEHVPPPRLKRKSSQPYPQKASKFAHQISSQGSIPSMQTGSLLVANGFVPSVSGAPSGSAWAPDTVSPGSTTFDLEDFKPLEQGMGVITEPVETPGSKRTFSGHGPEKPLSVDQGNLEACIPANPDFSKVYKFIGSVFDPGVKGHLKTLKEMASIDRETVLLLMRNLTVNLSSPDFRENKLDLPVYGMDLQELRTDIASGAKEQASPPCSQLNRLWM